MDILLLFIVLYVCVIAILGGNNGVGDINRNLEKLKPKMRKVKLPEKLKYYIPQWSKQMWTDPPGAIRKEEVYILTVILAICNYIFHALCFIGAIIVYILVPSAICWILLPIGCYMIVELVIELIISYRGNKIETKNRGRLDRDFTISKHDKKE